MKPKMELQSDLMWVAGEHPVTEAGVAQDTRADELCRILEEVQEVADNLTDEQFCAMVHEAAHACGFENAIDAWVSLLVVTEKRVASIDFRDFGPRARDVEN